MTVSSAQICLDVGTVRIGVAHSASGVRIAVPLTTIIVDGNEYDAIVRLARESDVTQVIIGLPRNQSGEETAQSQYVRKFAHELETRGLAVVFHDESLSSVQAEERLNARGGHYDKAAIDAEAAAIILQDYLEQTS